MPEPLLVARSKIDLHLLPQFANRHGLLALDQQQGADKFITHSRRST